ncbi:MAG: hypothetical protein ACI4NM_07030 [Bullifex sp.]
MKKIVVMILSLFLLFSCSLDNVWQKAGIASKKPLQIPAAVNDSVDEEGRVDMVRAILGDGHAISFSIERAEDFTGKVLRSLSSDELEALTATVKAKCYSEEEMKAFLTAPLTDEKILSGMKGTAQLFDGCGEKLSGVISACLPEIEIGEDAGEEEKSFAELYNTIVTEVSGWVEREMNNLLSPVTSFLTKETLTNGDYIACQLTVNLVDGLLASIEDVFTSALDISSNSRSVDITTSEGQNAVKDAVKKAGSELAKDAVSSVCHNLLTPIACMDQIANVYQTEVKLPSIASLLNLLKGGEKK